MRVIIHLASTLASVVTHVVAVAAVVWLSSGVVSTPTLDEPVALTFYDAPEPAPPPPPPPPAAGAASATQPTPVVPRTPRPVRAQPIDQLVTPTDEPVQREAEPVVEATPDPTPSSAEPASGGAPGGVAGGVPGGVAGGVEGGVRGGVVGGAVGGTGTGPVTPIFMPSDMTPPRLISGEQPGHTPQALSARVEGTMILRIAIRPDGSVGEVQVVRGLALLTEHVVATVSRWRFSPPVYQGRPISIYLTQRLRFEITGR